MADEIYTSSTYFGNVTAATVMRTFALKFGERDGSLLRHPTILGSWEDYSGINGAVQEELPILGLGLDRLTSRTEGQAAPNIQPSSTSVTPSVARQSGRYQMSGIARKRALRGTLAIPTLVETLLTAGEQTLINLIAAQFTNFTKSMGSTGTQLTVTTLKSACDYIRRSRAGGQLVAVLKPYQWEDLTNDGITLGGAFERSTDAQRMIGGLGAGSYQGRWLDGNVDVYTTDQVDEINVGADYSGGVIAQGGVAIRTEAPPESIAADVIAQMGYIRVEADRSVSEDDDFVVGHTYMGVTIAQQAGCVELVSRVAP